MWTAPCPTYKWIYWAYLIDFQEFSSLSSGKFCQFAEPILIVQDLCDVLNYCPRCFKILVLIAVTRNFSKSANILILQKEVIRMAHVQSPIQWFQNTIMTMYNIYHGDLIKNERQPSIIEERLSSFNGKYPFQSVSLTMSHFLLLCQC